VAADASHGRHDGEADGREPPAIASEQPVGAR
jgi:hypothetical protein